MSFSHEELEKGVKFLKKNNLYDFFALFRIKENTNDIPSLDKHKKLSLMKHINNSIENATSYIYALIYYIQSQNENEMEELLSDDEFEQFINNAYG